MASPLKSPSSSAFSLVESVIALGLLSFTVTSLFGVLAISMSTSRTAIDEGMRAQISRQLVAEVANSSDAGTYRQERVRYFDNEGLPSEREASVYSAAFRLNSGVEVNTATGDAPHTARYLGELEVLLSKNKTASISAPSPDDQRFHLLVRIP